MLKEFAAVLPRITVVVILLWMFTSAVSTALAQIDVATLQTEPINWVAIVTFWQTIFSSGTWAAGVVWLRNIAGYMWNVARANSIDETVAYDVNKALGTMSYYVGGLAMVFTLAPSAELRSIGALFLLFLDLAYSFWKRLQQPSAV